MSGQKGSIGDSQPNWFYRMLLHILPDDAIRASQAYKELAEKHKDVVVRRIDLASIVSEQGEKLNQAAQESGKLISRISELGADAAKYQSTVETLTSERVELTNLVDTLEAEKGKLLEQAQMDAAKIAELDLQARDYQKETEKLSSEVAAAHTRIIEIDKVVKMQRVFVHNAKEYVAKALIQIIEATGGAVALVDDNNRIHYVSEAAKQLMGRSEIQPGKLHLADLLYKADQATLDRLLNSIDAGLFDYDMDFKRESGKARRLIADISKITAPTSTGTLYMWTLISLRKKGILERRPRSKSEYLELTPNPPSDFYEKLDSLKSKVIMGQQIPEVEVDFKNAGEVDQKIYNALVIISQAGKLRLINTHQNDDVHAYLASKEALRGCIVKGDDKSNGNDAKYKPNGNPNKGFNPSPQGI